MYQKSRPKTQSAGHIYTRAVIKIIEHNFMYKTPKTNYLHSTNICALTIFLYHTIGFSILILSLKIFNMLTLTCYRLKGFGEDLLSLQAVCKTPASQSNFDT